MNTENFEYHVKRLEQRGWERIAPQLEEKMKTGEPEFSLYETGEIDGREVDFELTFRKHAEHDHYFFNHINASLLDNGEVTAQAAFRESWKLTPDEMYRILEHGSKVAVYKEGIRNSAGEPFNAYITVNVDQTLDDNGLLNLNMYHDNYYKNYPFELENALGKLPFDIKELLPENLGDIKAQLTRGIPVPVTILLDGKETEGYLTINAKIGRIDVLNSDLEPLQPSKKQQQEISEGKETTVDNPKVGAEKQAEDQSTAPGDDVKKKPWQNQRQTVNWNRNKQGKGVPR